MGDRRVAAALGAAARLAITMQGVFSAAAHAGHCGSQLGLCLSAPPRCAIMASSDCQLEDRVQQGLYDGLASGKVVSTRKDVKSMLKEVGVVWQQQLHCDHVGVHVQNRSGELVGPEHAHDLTAKIHYRGFVWAKTENATCFEASDDDKYLSAMIARNERLSGLSDRTCPYWVGQSPKLY